MLISHGQDDAWYVLLARALKSFRYVDLFVVGEPTHQLYPPGYPGALAFWSLLWGESVDAFILLNVLASAAAIAFAFFVWRRWLDERLALVMAAALAANPDMVQRAGMVVSEPLFLFLTMAVLWLSLSEDEAAWKPWAAGALAITAALTRTIGIALVVALLIHWLLERRWRAAALLGGASLLTVGVWLTWTVVAPDQFVGKSYIADFTRARRTPSMAEALARRLYRGTRYYLEKGIPWSLAVPTVPGTVIDNAAIAGLIVVGLLGGIVATLRRWRLASLYVIISAGILLIYPWVLHRFVVPLVPLILPFILFSLVATGRWMGPRLGKSLAFGFALAIAVNGLARTSAQLREKADCDRSGPMPKADCLTEDGASYFAALRHIRENLPPGAMVAAAKAAPLYYYTERQTPAVGAITAQSDSSFLPFLRATGADYILLGRLHVSEGASLVSRIRANCKALELEASFPPATFLFRVAPHSSAATAAASCAAAASYEPRWSWE